MPRRINSGPILRNKAGGFESGLLHLTRESLLSLSPGLPRRPYHSKVHRKPQLPTATPSNCRASCISVAASWNTHIPLLVADAPTTTVIRPSRTANGSLSSLQANAASALQARSSFCQNSHANQRASEPQALRRMERVLKHLHKEGWLPL